MSKPQVVEQSVLMDMDPAAAGSGHATPPVDKTFRRYDQAMLLTLTCATGWRESESTVSLVVAGLGLAGSVGGGRCPLRSTRRSAAPTRTPTDSCGTTSPRGPTSPSTPLTASSRSRTSSTTAPARPSDGSPQPAPSHNYSRHIRKPTVATIAGIHPPTTGRTGATSGDHTQSPADGDRPPRSTLSRGSHRLRAGPRPRRAAGGR